VHLSVVDPNSGRTTNTTKNGFCTTQTEIQANVQQQTASSSTDWVPFRATNTGKALKCMNPANATMCARTDDQCCDVSLGAQNYPPVPGMHDYLKENREKYPFLPEVMKIEKSTSNLAEIF
jgi:hypothetical protein